MMHLKSIFLPLIIILAILYQACQTSTEQKKETEETPGLEQSITGVWENVSLTVDIESKAGIPDSTDRFEVPAGHWEDILQIKPIRTTYLGDSTFTSVYRDLNDSVVHTTSGEWFVKKDTLYLVSEGVTSGYHTVVKSDTGTFTGYLDWDQDSIPDDLYTGVQRKISGEPSH